MMDQLNHPVAVIAILAGLAVFLREMGWFIKTATGKSTLPNKKDWEQVGKTLEQVGGNLEKQTVILDKLHDRVDSVKEDTTEIKFRLMARGPDA